MTKFSFLGELLIRNMHKEGQSAQCWVYYAILQQEDSLHLVTCFSRERSPNALSHVA